MVRVKPKQAPVVGYRADRAGESRQRLLQPCHALHAGSLSATDLLRGRQQHRAPCQSFLCTETLLQTPPPAEEHTRTSAATSSLQASCRMF